MSGRIVNFAAFYNVNINLSKRNSYEKGKKTPIEVMLFKKGNVQVIYPKGDGDAEEVIEMLSIPQHRLKVDFKKRKEFLTAFIPLLIDKEKGHGLSGVAPLARRCIWP